MLFQASITIPKSTPETAPTYVTMGIANGIITKFMVRPRPGHSAVGHLQILYHEHQIAPSTEDMDLHGDKDPIDWEDYYEVYQPPYELKLRGWSDSTKYEHTFDIFVAIVPRKAILPLSVGDAISGILGLISPKRIFTGGG